MIEILGPAAGPYSDYLDAHQVVLDNAGQTRGVFEVYRIYNQYCTAAVDLADALVLAADTDMLDPTLHEALEILLQEYGYVLYADEAKRSTDTWDAKVGAALELASHLETTLGFYPA